MTNEKIISTLNDLVETSRNGEKGFLEAAKHAHATHLRSLFSDYSADCASGARELQDCVRTLGGNPETGGSAAGAAHRAWMNMRTSVSSDDDLALLEECERGEDHAKNLYVKALEFDAPPAVRSLLERQYQGVIRHHDHIRDLRNRERHAA